MATDPRSWLFVPGDSEKKLSKIDECGADAVIIDLEDAVAPPNKAAARELTRAFLSDRVGRAGPQLWVRVNPLATADITADLLAVVRAKPAGLVLPKAEGPDDVAALSRLIDDGGGAADIAIHAIVTETARAVLSLGGFANGAPQRLTAMSWGAEDLSAALAASTNRRADGRYVDTIRLARSLTLLAAHACAVQPVEGLHADFRDAEGLDATCRQARAEGFGGRLAIHPAQVPVINAAFIPTEEEAEAAQRVIDAFAAAGDAGTIAIDGKMYDRPHLLQAQKTAAKYQQYQS